MVEIDLSKLHVWAIQISCDTLSRRGWVCQIITWRHKGGWGVNDFVTPSCQGSLRVWEAVVVGMNFKFRVPDKLVQTKRMRQNSAWIFCKNILDNMFKNSVSIIIWLLQQLQIFPPYQLFVKTFVYLFIVNSILNNLIIYLYGPTD